MADKPIAPQLITIELDAEEAGLVYQMFEQVPLQGPATKSVAATIQRKIALASDVVS